MTISLTNPGTIGTVHSVPRLMAGQGAIIGAGAMEYPAEFQGASEERIADLGRRQAHHPDVDLRPPHHPGRGVRRLPAHHPQPAARRRLLGRDLLRPRHPLRAGALAHRQPGLDRRQERPGDRTDRRLPQPRSPDGRHRPAAAGQEPVPHAPRSRRAHPRPDAVGSGPRVQGRRVRRQGAQEAARRALGAARRVLPAHRRGVHPHPRARAAALAAGAHRGPSRQAHRRPAEVHPEQAQRRRGLRDLPGRRNTLVRSVSRWRARNRSSR